MKHFSEIPPILTGRADQHLLRQRSILDSAQSVMPVINGKPMLSFCSNDYLGLANHPDLIVAMQQAAEQYGIGAGASHLVNGHHREHELLEHELAAFTGREAALLFGTGYMANLGVMAALMGRHDTILQDKLNHASLIDGGILSGAKSRRYRHNDMSHLSSLLDGATGKKLIVTDGVFSMDGDCADLIEMAAIANSNDAWLMVDDAHGIGTLGPQGSGLVTELGLSSAQVPLLVGTLGKAFGTSGAFVAGDKSTIDYILQFARTYTYTTATPPAIAAATRTALKLVVSGDSLRLHLAELIAHFRSGVAALGYNLMPSTTAIQPILIGDNATALRLSNALKERGLLVTAIRPPTVPVGTARLRITLSAEHTVQQVDQLLNVLEDVR